MAASLRPSLAALLAESRKLLASSRDLQEDARLRIERSAELMNECDKLLKRSEQAIAGPRRVRGKVRAARPA
jgi:hypothetical protein